jgi:hypothetical protein
MAIASVDDAIAGALAPLEWSKSTGTMEAASVWHSTVYNTGVPGAMVAPSSGLNGGTITSPRDGLISFADASPGETRLMRLSLRAPVLGTLILCDRLWDNSSIASATTTLQSITSPAFPARDRNGSANGEGVLIGLEFSTAGTNGAAIINSTVTYTDQSGNPGATATLASINTALPNVIPATPVAGTFVPVRLAARDPGVRAVEGITLGTSLGTAVSHLVAYRPLASVAVTSVNVEAAIDLVTGGAASLFDDSALFFIWVPTATTALGISGQLIFTQG